MKTYMYAAHKELFYPLFVLLSALMAAVIFSPFLPSTTQNF